MMTRKLQPGVIFNWQKPIGYKGSSFLSKSGRKVNKINFSFLYAMTVALYYKGILQAVR